MVFKDMISLCSPNCPGIQSVDQVDLKLAEIWRQWFLNQTQLVNLSTPPSQLALGIPSKARIPSGPSCPPSIYLSFEPQTLMW